MDFQEFCAASISPHQLEALENWENIASAAFEYFEEEGNRVTSVEELAQVCIIVIQVQMKNMNIPDLSFSSIFLWFDGGLCE